MFLKMCAVLLACILSLLNQMPAQASLPDKLQVITAANASQMRLLASYNRQPATDVFNDEQNRIFFTQDSRTVYYRTDTSIISLNVKTGDEAVLDVGSVTTGAAFSFDISHD